MCEPKKKCLFLNREIEKASNSIVEEDFFMKNYRKNDKSGHFEFNSI